ncbi:MAG: glutamate-5-semialdehyde dehydrogenase [Victivallaceae bacterium]|nr:glutamate-5-semialdehyde dehydrogenase [Victivallaceae bacterium]
MTNLPQNPTGEALKDALLEIGKRAQKASRALAVLSGQRKSAVLCAMADALCADREAIKEKNAVDMQNARESGLSSAMQDRLQLDDKRIDGMAEGLRIVASQVDPCGKILKHTIRPNGLVIDKVSVPIGVVAIIFESRPNVTSDAAGICIFAGNAVILRGGKEAIHSNQAIASSLNRAAMAAGLPDGVVQLIPWTGHEAVGVMLKMNEYIDLVIPRGGERLIRAVMEQSTIPVLKHYKGVCHLYVDKQFDREKALAIIVNAKCQRPSACNALETLLISRDALPKLAPALVDEMKRCNVELRVDNSFAAYAPDAKRAEELDWYTEYLDYILSVKVVEDVVEAVDHINHYGSKHSDGILSTNEESIAYFFANVDSATVYANASTRFTDGGEFGMGAEIGISTDKFHARGPMGADELTTYKYLVTGNGQIRS